MENIIELKTLLDEMTVELAKELYTLLDKITPQNVDTKVVCQAMMNELLNSCINQRAPTSTIACLYMLINQHYGEEE
jgi:hypothetical protein